jgi:hypothetical protein
VAIPSQTTVSIAGKKFNAYSAHFGISTDHEGKGQPTMGTLMCSIDFQVDINDTGNMPYATLQTIFDLANIVTKDKIVDMKIEFWNDDGKKDVVCSYTFRGWICHYSISSAGSNNPMLSLSVHPELGTKQFFNFQMGN